MNSWTPAEAWIGDLPLIPGGPSTGFAIPATVPATNNILVYSFITLHDVQPSYFTGYYKVYTKNGETEYVMYMNAPRVAGTVANSESMWLPYGPGFDPCVYVSFISNEPVQTTRTQKICTKGKCLNEIKKACCTLGANEIISGQTFIIGYN